MGRSELHDCRLLACRRATCSHIQSILPWPPKSIYLLCRDTALSEHSLCIPLIFCWPPNSCANTPSSWQKVSEMKQKEPYYQTTCQCNKFKDSGAAHTHNIYIHTNLTRGKHGHEYEASSDWLLAFTHRRIWCSMDVEAISSHRLQRLVNVISYFVGNRINQVSVLPVSVNKTFNNKPYFARGQDGKEAYVNRQKI